VGLDERPLAPALRLLEPHALAAVTNIAWLEEYDPHRLERPLKCLKRACPRIGSPALDIDLQPRRRSIRRSCRRGTARNDAYRHIQRSGVSRLKLLRRPPLQSGDGGPTMRQGRSQRRGQRRRARLCTNTAIASLKARGWIRDPSPDTSAVRPAPRRHIRSAVKAVVIMPKRRSTIPIAHADDLPTIAFTDEQWEAIELAYGRKLNDDVRKQITTVTAQYRKDCAFEPAAPKAMAQKRIERIRRAAGDLERVMLNREAFSASSDELSRQQRQSAHSYADRLIRRHLDERRSRITDSVLLAVETVTDRDGDTATTSTGIGHAIFFQDDRPGIAQRAPRVAHDETGGIDADDTTAAAVVALFNEVSNVSGDLSPTGYAQGRNAVVSSTGSAIGADQEGGTTAFSLAVSAASVGSGLDTTDGTSIFLFKEGDLVVGRIGGAAGAAAFAIAINSTSGVVSVAQYASIKHPPPGARDKLRHFRHELKSLVVACDCALNDLSAAEYRDGQAWGWWIQELTQIAQEHNLPAGVSTELDRNGRRLPFLRLVQELERYLPANARSRTRSPAALAMALSRARNT
jgi:hypothetical protein